MCPLVQLELNDVGISDSGLTHLETMDGLRFLSLAGSPVTDAGLESLSHFIDLETLNLGGTKVTKQGVSKIQDLLPGCRIAAN